ncbi:1,4-alpha-glucan branching protein domain-containing protein [Rhodococcoides kroppenstedtii]|uniref:1,4-alpha-glucan branching protein domain-containing protein n=1 Tax=Rhodococcoides kroppenstedtii TaxID=293050 RepID=UPI003530194F
MTESGAGRVPGMFALVLHSHLPWLPHHGRWPVGEEWLYQSWAGSYLRVVDVLRRLSAEGRTDLLTLGITPVLAAQLDDPHALDGMHHWLGNWSLRAAEAATSRDADRREAGRREYREAEHALAEFETRWRHGASPVLRRLVDDRAVELLGGPLMHPFQPLLDPRLRTFSLAEGLRDGARRLGRRADGIWAPECAFTAGMERDYAAAGVSHFLVDGPALRGDTTLGRPVGDTDVVAFGRDLPVSYRVWSPKSGYPGHAAYRDFHTYDHGTGLKIVRVTGRTVAGPDKAPYAPDLAAAALQDHVRDFVDVVRRRLHDEHARTGRPALVTAAFDTELFGHWWHEGPEWLEAVLRALPEAGVQVGTLTAARAAGFVGEPADLPNTSWGSGKDWRVWAGDPVQDLVRLNAEVTATALDAVDTRGPAEAAGRDRTADQILREALLTVSSDWAFMVSKDSAAQYARDRAHEHAHAVREIAAARTSGHHAAAARLAAGWSVADGLFPDLDARRLPTSEAPTGGVTRRREGVR